MNNNNASNFANAHLISKETKHETNGNENKDKAQEYDISMDGSLAFGTRQKTPQDTDEKTDVSVIVNLTNTPEQFDI